MKFGTNKLFLLVLISTVLLLAGCTEGNQNAKETHTHQETKLFDLVIAGFDDRPTTPHLPDHVYKHIGENEYVFLHFDKKISEATKLLYTGIAVPGRFCKEDQDKLSEGFTHFHQKFVEGNNPEAGHGGKGGEEGWWLKHVAVAEFDMPWGNIKPGVDYKFMPTNPPSCE